MGYNTDFYGAIKINRPVDNLTIKWLNGLCSTRRMKRCVKKLAMRLGISEEECINKYGQDAKHYFEMGPNSGQTHSDDIINYNHPPADQPGLWCNWGLGEDMESIVWTGAEKFYEYIAWMGYIVTELEERGYIMNGEIRWEGEDPDDKGILMVNNNAVSYKIGRAHV